MRLQLFGLAIAGLLVSGYLFISYVTGGPIVCVLAHGCDTVRASDYAHLLGLPTPLYGLVFYFMLAVGALFATKRNLSALRLPLFFLTTAGVLASLWLTYLEAFVIEAWCSWCVVSALLSLAAWLVATWSILSTWRDEVPR